MSEPKQYNISSLHPYIIEDKNGFMIYYEDYANLKAENEELHKDYEALADEHTKLIDRNARLKAEVERLKESLNKMTNTPAEADGVEVSVSFWTKYGSRLPSSYKIFWMNDAKEGKSV